MPIAHSLITKDEWVAYREPYNIETTNSVLIDKFNTGVSSLVDKYNGVLLYYKYVKNVKHDSNDILEYTESSPFTRLFKVSPNGYFIYNYPQTDLWKRHSIDDSILDKYLVNTNKYAQPDSIYPIQHTDYILFCLQATATYLPHSFNISGLFNIVRWAKHNNKAVYFKLHPNTPDNSHIYKIWYKLKYNGYITDHTILIGKQYNLDNLIDNASAVWTFSSGAAFQAILKDKAVVHFYPDTDYAPIATFAETPEQAYTASIISEEDKLRYLSWFYHKLTIDVTATDFINKLDERFLQVFKKRMTIDEIF